MAITPIYNNAMLQRTQDISQVKQNQDIKPQVEQHNIQQTTERQVERNARQIVEKNNVTGDGQERHDAREKGRGVFFDIRKKDAKEHKSIADEDDGIVIDKKSSRFDMRI